MRRLREYATRLAPVRDFVVDRWYLPDPVDGVSLFLMQYGSDCLTLYAIALVDSAGALSCFKRDLYDFLKETKMAKASLSRDEFLRFIFRRLPVLDRRTPLGASAGTASFWKLDAELQMILWLRDGMGLTYSEIAMVTEVMVKDVTSKIQEARRKMSEAMAVE